MAARKSLLAMRQEGEGSQVGRCPIGPEEAAEGGQAQLGAAVGGAEPLHDQGHALKQIAMAGAAVPLGQVPQPGGGIEPGEALPRRRVGPGNQQQSAILGTNRNNRR
jgi:hypothetical protein